MGDFPLLSRKISPYILRNEHHSAFKRKISAYFPNEETRQLWRVLLFYIPIPIPIRLSFRHVFYEKLFKTEPFNDFSICFFVYMDGAIIPFWFVWQLADTFSSVHFRVLLEDRDFH
jgi:hypothetical protein